MDNLLHFIKSTKSLLSETLDLCNALENDMESDKMNVEKIEECLNRTKLKFTQIESIMPDVRNVKIKLPSKCKKIVGIKTKLPEPVIDIANSMKVILFDIADKIVESHEAVDTQNNLSDDQSIVTTNKSETVKQSNIFSVLDKERNCKNKDEVSEINIVLSDISSECIRLSDNSLDKTTANESFESDKQLIVDELFLQSNAAREAILIDSDTESESVKESTSLIKECSVVLYDISKLSPNLKINENQNSDRLEREIKRLCRIPNSIRPNRNRKKNEKLKIKPILKDKKPISNIYQSDCEDSSEFSETKSNHSAYNIKYNMMNDAPLSSTDSESSEKSINDSKTVSNGKKKPKNKQQKKTKNNLKLTIPELSSSDSEYEAQASNSTNKVSNASKRKKIYCSTSSSQSESDASLTDLCKKVTPKKKPVKKSRNDKSNTSKKIKLSKIEPKLDKSKQSNKETDEDEIETRKNIHKIMTNAKLSKETKTAAQLEDDRRKRIEERQKEYNIEALDEDLLMISSNISLVLEKDEDGNVVVEVNKKIVDNLKPHQIEAVKFLWDCVIESVDCLNKSQQPDSEEDKHVSAVGGSVLAHCMGLGKTLSLIAFMHTMLITKCLNLRTCLVVCPVNTALNWKKEWEMWMPKEQLVNIYEVCSAECKKSKVQVVQDWHNKGGVLIIGYEMYRLLATGDSRTIRRKIIKQKLHMALVDPGPDFIVCDEGHLLKNNKSAINKVITKIHTKRRIVLTGTPLQNKLLEYHTMVQFVKPNLLGTQKEFLNRFVNPIHNGQHINSTPYDVSLMKKRSHILFKMLDGCVHRRDYSSLIKYLPPKYEYVIKVRLSDIQVQLYRQYIAICKDNKHSLFQDHLNFSRIWTHPFVICMHQEIMDKKMFLVDTDEDEDDSFINDDSDDEFKEVDGKGPKKASSNCGDTINLISDDSDADAPTRKKPKTEKKDASNSNSESSADEVVRNWSTTSRSAKKNDLNESDDDLIINGLKDLKDLKELNPIDKHWWSNIIQPEHEHQIEISGKLSVLFQILRKASDIGDKIIIFSQSLLVLDIIEKYLHELHTIAEKVQEDLQKLNESISQSPTTAENDPNKNNIFVSDVGYNSWVKGLDYDRMDGSTQAFVRADIQARFNSVDDQRLRLFLISTRAGGMGVNLVAANRVIIFDVSWNPSNDIQAIFRSYRFGQNKPVYVYRFVSQGTMEEKIYERQVTKQSLSLRVVDEQQISRYFTEEDLRSLYKFEPDIYDPDKVRETPILPKDRFLAELIQELPQFIHGYHEHDSLLQNKTEEELTELERRDAWKEFEEEKLHGTRAFPMNQNQLKPNVDSGAIQQLMMLQQYPQYATLYAQNYNNLVKYVLSRKPDLSPIQLNNEVQHLFLQSLQKYYNNQASMMASNNTAGAVAGSSQIKCLEYPNYCQNSSTHDKVQCHLIMEKYYKVKYNGQSFFICPTCQSGQSTSYLEFYMQHRQHLDIFKIGKEQILKELLQRKNNPSLAIPSAENNMTNEVIEIEEDEKSEVIEIENKKGMQEELIRIPDAKLNGGVSKKKNKLKCLDYPKYCNSSTHDTVQCHQIMEKYYKAKSNGQSFFICPTCQSGQSTSYVEFYEQHRQHLDSFKIGKEQILKELLQRKINPSLAIPSAENNMTNEVIVIEEDEKSKDIDYQKETEDDCVIIPEVKLNSNDL